MDHPRCNILYLHSHDTGRYLGSLAGAGEAPNLRRLADGGVAYRQAFCASPTCSPSRAALLTGQHPHECGQWGLPNYGYSLEHPERTFVNHLAANGYHTALLGVHHVTREAEETLGYQEVREDIRGAGHLPKDAFLRAESVGPEVERWLAEHAGDDRPWFLDAGVVETHNSSWRWLGEDDRPSAREINEARGPAWLADLPEARHWRAHYDRVAQRLDRYIGRVLDALDRHGLADRTLVIYTTDHGPGTPLAKCTLYDAGLGVGLILRGPGGFTGGGVVHEPVSHLDLFPTLCDRLGLALPTHALAGRPLPMPGDAPADDRLLFFEINAHGSKLPERAVRSATHKLIRRYYDDPADVAHNTDRQPLHEAMQRLGWPAATQPRIPAGQAYSQVWFDHRLDPTERQDRSDDLREQAELHRLQQALETWMSQTHDPLADAGGCVPDAPRVSGVSGVSGVAGGLACKQA